jgi:hypothetical protein
VLLLQVSNTATLVAGSGVDAKTYSDTASASIAVTQCDVQPEFSVTTPNMQTALTFAWSQQITPLASTALQVQWGGGASLPAQATFTRTVTSAVLSVSFDVAITNPSKGPIALTNVQLSCPWGGNTLLPCGAVSGYGGGGTLLVIPGSGAHTCYVFVARCVSRRCAGWHSLLLAFLAQPSASHTRSAWLSGPLPPTNSQTLAHCCSVRAQAPAPAGLTTCSCRAPGAQTSLSPARS